MSFDHIAFTKELTRVFNLVSSRFDKVVVTGSAALVFLIQHHKLFSDRAQEHLKSIGYSVYSESDCQNISTQPNDIDMIIVQNTDFTETKIGNYFSEQSICGSKTFVSADKCQINFDLIKMPRCKYIKLKGINIIHPMLLLDNYRENYRDNDAHKLKFLQDYVDYLKSLDSEIFEINKRQSSIIDDSDSDSESESGLITGSITDSNICKKLF